MNILGISAFYHDSAACLVRDGEIVAAAQEERFTRKKHDPGFPQNAIDYCLCEGGISVADLDLVGFYEKPFVKFERLVQTYVAYAPVGIGSFLKAMPRMLKEKLFMRDLLKKRLGYAGEVVFTSHHESHAASAFYPSPFPEAAFLTVDGVGEWATATWGVGKVNEIDIRAEIHFPHSLGLLYSAFTYFTGFKVNSGEYKLMGLAPYGEPKYVDLILDNLVDLKEDGSFRLNMKYFNYCAGLTMTNRRFDRLFGGPPRKPDTEITRREMDMARSVQAVAEEIIMRMVRHVHRMTRQRYLCLAGGVALNCVANGRVLREGPFEDIWIQPGAGDAGGALGVALFTWYRYLGNERKAATAARLQKASYLGPSFSDEAIEAFLRANDVVYEKLEREELVERVADLIAQQKVVGWFQDRLEFGPRALGSRSIVADARSVQMQSVLNLKIKYRESFRPFAPSVLREDVQDYFELDHDSPYMLLVAPVASGKLLAAEPKQKALSGLDRLKVGRSEIPAVTHVDNSARIQTVSREDNPLYHALIDAFKRRTGCPVIVNTSFNVRGEPIVCTTEDAYTCFMRTQMDYLVMGRFLVDKKLQIGVEEYEGWQKDLPPD
jgi:carbamoyltransferase